MRTEEETFDQYVIKWNARGARVFYSTSGLMANQRIFPNKEAAKLWIEDSTEDAAANRKDPGLPTVYEYTCALTALNLTKNELSMIKAHRNADGMALTPEELASAAGKTTYKFTNRWYGGLGKKIAEFLKLPVNYDEDRAWTNTIASYDEPRWVMHPEFAQALDELNLA